MPQAYFDERGRRLNDHDVLRDLLGRNRERAMRMLGLETRERPAPVGLDFVEVQTPEGLRIVPRPAERADDE